MMSAGKLTKDMTLTSPLKNPRLISAEYCAVFFPANREPQLANELFRLRKTLFVDICGWELPVTSGREVDVFDTSHAIYCALCCEGALVGGFRALRTDRPYLGESIFPNLAKNRPYPRDVNYWEISRFGVVPTPNSARHAVMNYSAMLHFGFSMAAKGLVAIADSKYERFLRMNGIRTERYGPPQIIGENVNGDGIEVLAGEIPLENQSGPKFKRLLSHANTMEISDVAQIFRRYAISA